MAGTLKAFRKEDSVSSRLSLWLILSFQAALSLFALHNTAFEDEALYLFAGKQILRDWRSHHFAAEPYGSYFSGYPTLYPVIAGMLDMVGRLEAARMLSLVCMLGVTVCVFWTTEFLVDRKSATAAAILFSFQGTVLFLGRLATYDSMCLLLLALATVLALRASTARKLWEAFAIGPLSAFAVASKYAGLLFVPTIFALLVWRSLQAQGWLKTVLRAGIALGSLAVAFLILYNLRSEGVLRGLGTTTLHRVISERAPLDVLLNTIVELGGLIYLLGLVGLLMNGVNDPGTGLLLFASSLLVPVYHLDKGELVSLHKHIAFGLFFIMPLAGYVVARLITHGTRVFNFYRLAGVAIVVFSLILGLHQAYTLYHSWPSSSELVHLLQGQVRPGNDRYLVEECNVSRFYLQNASYPWQWTSLDYFEYTDQEKRELLGKDAYIAAIGDGYFKLIELNFGARAGLAKSIDQAVRASGRYDLLVKSSYPSSFGPGDFWIWRLKPSSP